MERMYRVDQDVLDERGIGLSVEEVVGLSTAEYSVRLRRLNLSAVDAAFVKSLRRRIKNRMASQNSRRRTAEHIRSLADELRAVRAGKDDVLEERSTLTAERARLTAALRRLCRHITEKLKERGDESELPFTPTPTLMTSQVFQENCISTPPNYSITLSQPYVKQETDLIGEVEKKKSVFECRLESLVQRSVSHMYKFERHNLDINNSLLDECKKTNLGMNMCEQTDPASESSNLNDESESNDLISDMMKLNNFAAEISKPKNAGMETSSGLANKLDKSNHMEVGTLNGNNLDTYSTKDASKIDNAKNIFQMKSSIIDKRKTKHIGYPTIKLMADTYRNKTIVDVYKIPPKDPIAPEVPKIIRAKCVTIACDDAKEELNARKPRRRNKDTALREAKQATFRQIMEATYKEINGGFIKEISKEYFKDVKESPFKDENEFSHEIEDVSCEDDNESSMKHLNESSLKKGKEFSFNIMYETSLKDVKEPSLNDTKGSYKCIKDTFIDAKRVLQRDVTGASLNAARFEDVKEAMLREARAAPKNGCIVHTSDAQYKEAEVLNLSVRGERRHHGRKQAAPRRIAHAPLDTDDAVLDLKIKRDGV